MVKKISSYTSTFIFSLFLIGYANASDKDIVHSTDYVKGSLKAYNIHLIIETNGVDGGIGTPDGFEMLGNISTKTLNGKPIKTDLWRCDEYCTDGLYDLEISDQIIMDGGKDDTYIQWEGVLWDHDGSSAKDLICRMNPEYKIKMSDEGSTIGNEAFTDNKNECNLKIESFEAM